jgi:hypothetical protein
VDKISAQGAEFTIDSARASDHDMIRTDVAGRRDDFAGKLSETALHAISNDRPADLLADREAHALLQIAVLAITYEKDESRRRCAQTAVRSEKIRAFAEDC